LNLSELPDSNETGEKNEKSNLGFLMYAIGVDSGTQSTKVLIVDFSGKVLGRGNAHHDLISGLKPGESEQDPSEWVKALKKALANALKEAKINPRDIVSLGISGQQHGFVPLDKKGLTIRPAKLWNDTSTSKETEELIEQMGGQAAYIQKLGIGLAVGFTASKILWLKKHEPDNYKRLNSILLPHNYLNFVLTGKRDMEYGDASGTGLMDIRNLKWHPQAMSVIDENLESLLPPINNPSEPVGFIQNDFCKEFGLGKVLVSSGGGDNMMSAVGTGNTIPGICTLSLGTSGTIFSYFEQPFVDPSGEIAAFCDSTGGWLPLLCTMNVTNTTEHLKSLLDITNNELETLAAQAPSGSDDLVFLPFLDGERVPVLPDARGVLFGMNRSNISKSHLARAFMEGTILNLGYGLNRMRSLGLVPTQIRATGGGANSLTWLHIVADIFQTPVLTLEEQESAALGAAIQSIWCYSLQNGEDIPIRELTDNLVKTKSSVIQPDPMNFPVYEKQQERFNSLWQTLKKEF